jgi:hypothetical protein
MSAPARGRRYAGGMKYLAILVCLAASVSACAAGSKIEVWKLEKPDVVGGHKTEVLGAPKTMAQTGQRGLCFNGVDDGLIIPVNPIQGQGLFSIEILFRPDSDGPAEQRFLHIQDEQESRVLIETRVADGAWSLDTFLRATDADKLTLLDRAKTSPANRWYWAALVYDGKTMSHYVQGKKELEGAVAFPPMGPGRMSLGVRQNRIHWFKGCIAQVRFTPWALAPEALQR